MLEVRNWEVFGLQRSILASKNPMSMGEICTIEHEGYDADYFDAHFKKDIARGCNLGSAPVGSGHDNFLSGISVYFDVKYPLYWSPEFQRYHFNQIISSQSTMHRLTYMASTKDFEGMFNQYVDREIIKKVESLIVDHNEYELWRKDGKFIQPSTGIEFTKQEWENLKYIAFMKVRSNLPSGFEMWMTVRSNYLQLKTMYLQRKNHKLREDWKNFCDWILTLPMFVELTGINA